MTLPDRDRYDVVVCGAGAGGLTAARAFASAGAEVLVVDKAPAATVVHKGEVLQPASTAALARLGVVVAGRRAARLVCARPDGRAHGTLDYRPLPTPHPYLLLQPYDVLTRAVEKGSGAEVRRGVHCTGLLGTDRVGGVRLRSGDREVDVRAELVVAADGRGSKLRAAAGIATTGARYEHDLVAFDVAGEASDVVAHVTREGLRLVYPLPGGRVRVYVQVPCGEWRSTKGGDQVGWLAGVVAATPALAPYRDALVRALPAAQAFPAYRAAATALTVPGLALAGDAAHTVHPMAAQGMNAAVADATALAEAFRAASGDAALAAYASARAADLPYVSRLSHSLARLFTATGPLTRAAAAHMLRRNESNHRLRYVLAHNMAGLGVRRFTLLDRLHQLGLPDPRRDHLPLSLPVSQ